MVVIEKIYKTSCKPCVEVGEILKDLQQTRDFELHEYNIEDGDFKERKNGKRLLTRWGTIKIPLILFSINGEVKRALYGGVQQIDKTAIEDILIELEELESANEQVGEKEEERSDIQG